MHMHAPDMTDDRSRDSGIVAKPPLGQPPFNPKEPLPVSRPRVCLGVVVLVIGLVAGFSVPLFVAAKLWFGGIGLLLMSASFWILGLHRLRWGRGRESCMHTSASNQSLQPTA